MAGGKMHNLNVAISNIKGKIKEKKPYTRDKKQFLKSRKGDLVFKKVDQSELKKVNKKLRKQIRIERKKYQRLTFLSMVIFLIIIGRIVYLIGKTEKKLAIIKKEQYFKENLSKYNYFIKDGDKWLKKCHYKNAVFQYKKALEIFPNDSLALSKLLEIEVVH